MAALLYVFAPLREPLCCIWAAAYYKAKCVMCHGKKAEKKFNATLTDDQMVEVVLVATVISDSYIFSVLQITLSCDVYNQPDDF
jgi:hypothetical protein